LTIKEQIAQHLLEHNITNVQVLPPVGNEIVQKEMQESKVILILEDLDKKDELSKGNLTGKVFECLTQETHKGRICSIAKELDEFFEVMDGYMGINSEVVNRFYRGEICKGYLGWLR
jgi:hypothetical protein